MSRIPCFIEFKRNMFLFNFFQNQDASVIWVAFERIWCLCCAGDWEIKLGSLVFLEYLEQKLWNKQHISKRLLLT